MRLLSFETNNGRQLTVEQADHDGHVLVIGNDENGEKQVNAVGLNQINMVITVHQREGESEFGKKAALRLFNQKIAADRVIVTRQRLYRFADQQFRLTQGAQHRGDVNKIPDLRRLNHQTAAGGPVKEPHQGAERQQQQIDQHIVHGTFFPITACSFSATASAVSSARL